MKNITLLGLRKRTTASHDLDAAIAGTQIGLEKKRRRWLVFLIEREEQCSARIAQDAQVDGQYPMLEGGGVRGAAENRLLSTGAHAEAEDLRAG